MTPAFDARTASRLGRLRVLVAGAALLSATAFAQDTGFTLGANLGGAHWKGNDAGGLAVDSSDTGGKIFGGYRFSPYFGVEAGYADLGKFSGPSGNLKANGYFVDAVGTWPLAGTGLSLLGRVGAFDGKLRSDTLGVVDHERSTNLKVGAGLQYDLNPRLALRTEWERYRFDAIGIKDDTDLYSVGVNYRF